MDSKYTGKYTKAFLSDKKVDIESTESKFYNSFIEVKDNEAVYIYSFKGNRLLFVKGFQRATNKRNEDLSIIDLNNLFTSPFDRFINEYHDRFLLYLYNNNKNIDTLSSNAIMRINGNSPPFMFNVKSYETDKNGNLMSVIGRCTFDLNLKTTDVIQYSIEGDFDSGFIDVMNNDLDFEYCVSQINIKIIEEFTLGNSLADTSKKLSISQEQIKINIDKLTKKFDLETREELIQFAKDNYLIPNQFEGYLKK